MTAVDSLAGLLAEHDPYHTPAYHKLVAGKLLAQWDVIAVWRAEDKQDPHRVTLRQQKPLELDDQDAWLEEAKEAWDRYHYALGVLRALGSPHVDRFDPDEVVAEREDRRDTERAQDEAADRAAVRP